MDQLSDQLENIQRYALIGTVVVLFPVWIPIGIIALLLIALGYICDKCYDWMAQGGRQ